MEDVSEGSEASFSMGPPIMMSGAEGYSEYDQTNSENGGFLSPLKDAYRMQCAMGSLSLSTIAPIDSSQPVHLMSVMSPEAEFKPDILMSTCNTKPVDSLTDLSISMGPLSPLSSDSRESAQFHSIHVLKLDSSLAGKIELLDLKSKQAQKNHSLGNKVYANETTQTEQFQCMKCDEMLRCFDQKLLEMVSEIQQQYNVQFQIMDEHVTASEEQQKQINDLMEQLKAADGQLKENRRFLDQQAIEREQEREEAIEQLTILQAALSEREKECERAKDYCAQVAADLQHLQEILKEKDEQLKQQSTTMQQIEEELQTIKISRTDLEDENNSMQQVLVVKDKLLKAQADQIAALQAELENQLQLLQQPPEAEENVEEPLNRRDSTDQDLSTDSLRVLPPDMPSLFDELQQMIVQLTRKVEQSTRTLEAVQFSKPQSTLISPRSHITPATSTEDISVKDRTRQTSIDNLRELSPSPPAPRGDSGAIQPEATLSFLHQLDNKLAALSRVEEAACKRIADLEAELRRTTQAEKQCLSKVSNLEEQHKHQASRLHDVEAEKRELQAAHTELLKRISSLENRLAEQRRSAALSQNPYSEMVRTLSEEKEELMQVVRDKEESLSAVQDQMRELQQRIAQLVNRVQEKEQEVKRYEEFSSIERLRHDVQASHQQESCLSWAKMNVQHSPVALSPVLQHLPFADMPPAVHFELEELRSKLAKSTQESQALCGQLTNQIARVNQLETFERRCAELEDELKDREEDTATLKEQLAASEREIQTLRDQIVGHDSRVESVTNKLADREQRCSTLEEQLSASRRECESLRNELIDRQSQFQSMEQEANEGKDQCGTLESQLAANRLEIQALQAQLTNQMSLLKSSIESKDQEERCAALENQLAEMKSRYNSLEQQLENQQKSIRETTLAFRKAQEEATRQRTAQEHAKVEIEAIRNAKSHAEDDALRLSASLEAETEAHLITKRSLTTLQQRYAALTNDTTTAQELQATRQQCAALTSQLETKEQTINELVAQLKWTDKCKVQVEQALKQLQKEVELVKQVQQLQEESNRAACSRESFVPVPEGPAAPPDLLAPSFIEFLGSTSGSCQNSDVSSVKSLSRYTTLQRTGESTFDCSLPSSMLGKKTLRSVQKESEQLLEFGQKLLEQQRQEVVRESQTTRQQVVRNVKHSDSQTGDDLESTLKAEEQFQNVLNTSLSKAREQELLKKVQLLEAQLALERLLLKDQKAANDIQQKQMIELLSQQRQQLQNQQHQQQHQQLQHNTRMSGKITNANKMAFQYRSMKLESQRKNLIYQKRFLTSIVNEYQIREQKEAAAKVSNHNRFKIAALAIISIQRMRFVRQQWNHRRKVMEVQ